jgi:K+-transporting ATPase ATPase A chain
MADLLYFALFTTILALLMVPLGHYMAALFQGKKTFLHPVLHWLEVRTYKIAGIDSRMEMSWGDYAKALLLFNAFGAILLFIILLVQHLLPLNPQHLPSVPIPLAFNITISFVTNTNWQSYAGETTLSYLSQMVGLTVQNFLSGATGLVVFLPLVRGLVNNAVQGLGNFWVDLTRSLIYVLIPLAIVLALLLTTQGVIQNLSDNTTIHTLEGQTQLIPGGQVASQIAIKQLGSNGGGFFNANSAHPFENPTPISDFLENLSILLIPGAVTYAYGLMIGSRRHGLLILEVMIGFWAAALLLAYHFGYTHSPLLNTSVNLEGIETRFGIGSTALWTASTTTAANGSVNAALSSLPPLAGGVALFNMLLDDLIFGGIGVGLCHMIMFIILTVFMAGLMVGRTPQYLGKRIERTEMQWVAIAILLPGILILFGSGLSTIIPAALEGISDVAPHGLTELIYAFASAAANNGSSFAGLHSNNDYYNIVLAVVMLLARLGIIIPTLALAGALTRKKVAPVSIGTFSTETSLFASMLAGIILIAAALIFFPILSLGPVLEHFLMVAGR